MVKLGQRGSLCGSWRSSEGSQGVKRDVSGAVGDIEVKEGILGVLGDPGDVKGDKGDATGSVGVLGAFKRS